VAPGYTLLLAATIGLFGDLAPYWLNLLLLLAALPFIWLVFRQAMGSDRAAALSLLGLWVIAFGGDERNAPFLLYPFRETPVLLCLFAAYAALQRAAAARRPLPGALAAGLLVIAACSFREPSVFLVPGLLLGLLALPSSRSVRLKLAGGFLLPWLGLAAVGAAAFLLLGYAGSSQFEAVRYLRGYEVAWARIKQMIPWIPLQAGWLGTALIAFGILRAARRAPLLLAWLLAPAVLLFVFYAFMQMHNRYFLTSFLFLAAFAGYGLDGLLGLAEKWTRNPAARTWTTRATTATAVAVLLLLMVQIVRGAKPWGPRITGAEVREWQRQVQALTPGPDGRVRVAVEQRCRYLEDLLLAYTDVEELDPKQSDEWPEAWWPAYYFRPVNNDALYATPQWLMYLTIYGHRILADEMNVIPVDPGRGRAFTIGRGRYALNRVTPWTAGSHQQLLDVEAARDHVVWFDWGAAATGAVRSVTIENAETGAPWLVTNLTGCGLQALHLPAGRVDGSRGRLRVAASAPLPDQPAIAVRRLGEYLSFDVDEDRLVSLNRLMPRFNPASRHIYPVQLGADRWETFLPPALELPPGLELVCRFQVRSNMDMGWSMAVRDADGAVGTRAVVQRGRAAFVEVPVTGALAVRPADPAADSRQVRLDAIALAVRQKQE
jgi:hypothetical protein